MKLHTGDQVNVPAFVRPWEHLRRSWREHTTNYIAVVLSLSTVILHLYICIYICNFHRRLIRFPSNLHVTGFSSCRISSMVHSYLVCEIVLFKFFHQAHLQEVETEDRAAN